MGNWAAGALAIGIGVIPLVAGLTALFRAPGEQRSREARMVRSVMVAGFVGFGLYTALKSAYLSTQFATRVEERNLIYVAPLLFVGTALVLERRRVNLWALAAAGAYALYLVGFALYQVVGSPYEMGIQLYSDSLGFSILQQANRYIGLDTTDARIVLIGATIVGGAALLAPMFLRRRERLAAALTASLAVLILAWSVTGEIGAAAGTVSISRSSAGTLRHPFSWIDAVTGGSPTLYMGQGETDPNPENLVEFWNRSIVTVSSLDGSVGGPGPSGGPNLGSSGALLWPRQYGFAVEDWPCVDLAGTLRGEHDYSAGGTTRDVAAAPAVTAEPAARDVHRPLRRRLDRAERRRVLPLHEGTARLAPHLGLSPLPKRPVGPEPRASARRQARGQREPPAGPRARRDDGRPDDRHADRPRSAGSVRQAHASRRMSSSTRSSSPGHGDLRTLGAQTTIAFFKQRPSGTQSTCR